MKGWAGWIPRREEVRVHCEKCYDDKTGTSEVQAERIRHQRSGGDSLVALQGPRVNGDRRAALQGRQIQITVDRGSSRSEECLPMETLFEVSHWFDKRFKTRMSGPEAWQVLRLVFLKKPDAKLENQGLRGFRAITLLSLFSEWYATVLVDLLLEEKKPVEMEEFARGSRERRLRTHAIPSYTYIPETWEWQEDRRTDLQPGFYRKNTAFMASLDVKTAFDVGHAISGIQDTQP